MRSPHARRFIALGIKPGDRVALVAETGPEFAACFFGAVYAGAWPVPLPLPTSFGGREAYVDQLARPARTAAIRRCSSIPPELAEFCRRRRRQAPVCRRATGTALAEIEAVRRRASAAPAPDDIAYLQYSSGSTRFPHGVAVTHRALLDNLHAHGIGLKVEDTDRCISGCPGTMTWAWSAACCRRSSMQMSVDYLKTEDFARRPLAWLDMITPQSRHARQLFADLRLRHLLAPDELADPRRGPLRPVALAHRRQWRRHDPPRRHAGVRRQLRRRRLQGQRLLPELRPRRSDARRVADAARRGHPARAGRGERAVRRAARRTRNARAATAPSSIAASRSPAWRSRSAAPTATLLPDRGIGKVFVRGASVMHSYFRDEESTDACLSDDGWLDTGDMGYMSSGYIFIVGRAKDMIIINGRNHWPQDIEWAVEQLPGFKSGDIAAFAITGPSGEETPAVLVHCRVSRPRGARPPARRDPRARPRDHRHHAGGRARPAAHPAAHQLGQAVAHQGAQPLSLGRDPAVRHRRLTSRRLTSRIHIRDG